MDPVNCGVEERKISRRTGGVDLRGFGCGRQLDPCYPFTFCGTNLLNQFAQGCKQSIEARIAQANVYDIAHDVDVHYNECGSFGEPALSNFVRVGRPTNQDQCAWVRWRERRKNFV